MPVDRRRAPSQKDVAELAGVSSQTVSRVVNGSARVEEGTRERVRSAMSALGYQANGAARALATGRSRSFGVISFDLSAHNNARTIEAIASAAQDEGYSVTIAGITEPTEEAIQRAYDRLTSQAVDGVVLIEAQILDTGAVRLPTSVPVVIADGDPDLRAPGAGFPAVDTNQDAGAREATQHLLDLGHPTVWHVAGPPDSHAARRRSAAWQAVLEGAGRRVPPVLYGDWSTKSGLEAGRELAVRDDVTAIFAANDHMALGVIRALCEAGRSVPEDVSIVGFDDVREAFCFAPPLTTVHQYFEELGQRCVALLLDQMRQTSTVTPDSVVAIQPHLIVRSSTAAPRTLRRCRAGAARSHVSSPAGRRHAVAALERTAECRLRRIADPLRDERDGKGGAAEQVGGGVEAHMREVRGWRHPDPGGEPRGERRPGKAARPGQFLDLPVVTGVLMDSAQGQADLGVERAGEPVRLGVGASGPGAQNLDEQQIEDAGDHHR